jgi:hypothetical protein
MSEELNRLIWNVCNRVSSWHQVKLLNEPLNSDAMTPVNHINQFKWKRTPNWIFLIDIHQESPSDCDQVLRLGPPILLCRVTAQRTNWTSGNSHHSRWAHWWFLWSNCGYSGQGVPSWHTMTIFVLVALTDSIICETDSWRCQRNACGQWIRCEWKRTWNTGSISFLSANMWYFSVNHLMNNTVIGFMSDDGVAHRLSAFISLFLFGIRENRCEWLVDEFRNCLQLPPVYQFWYTHSVHVSMCHRSPIGISCLWQQTMTISEHWWHDWLCFCEMRLGMTFR